MTSFYVLFGELHVCYRQCDLACGGIINGLRMQLGKLNKMCCFVFLSSAFVQYLDQG